jgi:hypothetical protein
MANKIISNLDQLSDPQGSDILPITDVSDPTGSSAGTTKRVSLANVVNLANIGNLRASNNLSDLSNASTARTNLGVDASGTDNSTDVTLSGTPDYITISGQEITRNQIDLTSDVTGSLPNASVSGLGSLATQSSIDGTAITSTGQTGGTKFLREDGDGTCSFQTISITDENLRGTDNPHIGAFPNQSFKVLDNPSKSAMILADSNGSIKFIARDTSANVFVKKGNNAFSRLAEASELPSFIISKDSGEPDIELTDSDGEVYSVVSGDSDTLGANGIPARQGYQLPSIGANPAPLLISGGTIS